MSAFEVVGPAGAGGMGVIFDSTLGADAANFDITSITGTFKHLMLVASVRGTSAVTNENSLIRFNNDSGANYDISNVSGVSDSASGRTTAGATAYDGPRNTGSSATAGRFAGWELTIPDYAGTTAHKTIMGTCGLFISTAESGLVVDATAGLWRSASAITRITILPGSGNWLAGSRVTLYGLP